MKNFFKAIGELFYLMFLIVIISFVYVVIIPLMFIFFLLKKGYNWIRFKVTQFYIK